MFFGSASPLLNIPEEISVPFSTFFPLLKFLVLKAERLLP